VLTKVITAAIVAVKIAVVDTAGLAMLVKLVRMTVKMNV
jgi:ABC-type transporter Mla MlaB component